ncbi:MAG: lipopolysaccharide biosynthesis protein RfbH [Verrucomicrobiales bacterium]
MSDHRDELRRQILELTRQYSQLSHRDNLPGDHTAKALFVAGQHTVPYAARVFDADEVESAVAATLDFWLTLGREGEAFEAGLATFLSVKRSLAVNSGSSANLLAMTALTSHKLPADRRVRPGDEIITVAAGFPTTVAPIVQNGAVPVFIDADPRTGNARVDQLEQALSPGKTKAVMMAHALGNPFDLAATLEFCRRHNLWLIEDNCDALGCSYSLPAHHPAQSGQGTPGSDGRLTKWTGSWGDLSTQSFYPPHHLTMGEGGAVNIVRDMRFKVIVESFRDWGRDCWCASGKDNTCNKRFGWQLGELPHGYDHKYIYSHLGYNLKPLDIQAAIGRRQLEKLPAFIQARKDNWQYLRAGLAPLEEFFDFALPTHATAWNPDGTFQWDDSGCRTECSWFGFKMTVRENAPCSRTEVAAHLDEKKIGNRMLFGGNLVRQPAFVQLARDNPAAFRVAAPLDGADRLMNRTLFIGTYPGLTRSMLDYEIETLTQFCRR